MNRGATQYAGLTAYERALAAADPHMSQCDAPHVTECATCKRRLTTIRRDLDALAEGFWLLPKVDHVESRPVGPIVRGRWVHRAEGQSDAEHTRFYAAQLLAAADEADRRAEEDR